MADLAKYPPWRGDRPSHDNLAKVDAELWERHSIARSRIRDEHGIVINVISAWRDTVHQKILYDCWLNRDPRTGACRGGCGSCNLAAVPGTSNHERGLALDLSPGPRSIPQARAIYAEQGIHFPVVPEDWHAELAPSRAPLPDFPAPKPPEPIMGDLSSFLTIGDVTAEARRDPNGSGILIRFARFPAIVTGNPQWSKLRDYVGSDEPIKADDIEWFDYDGRFHLRLWSYTQPAAFVAAQKEGTSGEPHQWQPAWYPA